MATPTFAEVWTQVAAFLRPLEKARLAAYVTATTNWEAVEGAAIETLELDYADRATAALARARASFSSVISRESARAVLEPFMRQLGRTIGSANADKAIGDLLQDIYDYFVTNTQSLNSRGMTLNQPVAAGGNVGNGTILRLTVGEDNFPLEATSVASKRARIVRDQNTGTQKHEEVLRFESLDGPRDSLGGFTRGTGERTQIAAKSARDSLLLNASFTSFSGTIAAPTAITNWTSSVTVNGTNYSVDQTNTYRGDPSDGGTPASITMKVTAVLSQALSVRRSTLDRKRPYMFRVAWNRAIGTASGTLRIDMGSRNGSVVVAAQTGWNLLYVIATPGTTNNWFENFNEDALDLRIDWTRTGGELLVDDALFVPFERFDGGWYLPIGGATAWLVNDEFTWSDTVAADAVISAWMWWAYGFVLPTNNAGAETIADPA